MVAELHVAGPSGCRSTTSRSTTTRPTPRAPTADDLPVTEAVYAHVLSLPLFYDLTVDEQDTVVTALRRILLMEVLRRVTPPGAGRAGHPARHPDALEEPDQFVGGVSPVFLERGPGAHVWDVDGNEYIDYPMALGPVLLGYAEPAVDEAIRAPARATASPSR